MRNSTKSIGRFIGVLLLASAATQSGAADFGRGDDRFLDQNKILNGKVFPLLGSFVARFRKEPVSHFNLTDEEKFLRSQAGHLIAPPHARDWLHQVAAHVQRYRITAPIDKHLSADAYYAYLRSDRFRSTAGRYNRLSADIAADAALIPGFFSRAAQVMASDELRLRAVNVYDGSDPNPPVYQRPIIRQNRSLGAEASARVYENQEIIAWSERAVAFRIESYRRAIARLAIEEPNGRVGLANGELLRLEFIFDKARLAHLGAGRSQQPTRQSRYMRSADSNDSDGAFDLMPDIVPQK